MQDTHDSDFLPCALAAVVVLIMAVAVRINANESKVPGPPVHDPGEQEQEPQRAGHSPAHAPGRV